MRKSVLQVALPEEMVNVVKKQAQETHTSVSYVIREAVRIYVCNLQKYVAIHSTLEENK